MENELLSRLGMVACLGTGIILLVFFLCRLLPRLPGAVRCWLWWTVCLKLLLDLGMIAAISLPVLPIPPPVSMQQIFLSKDRIPEPTRTISPAGTDKLPVLVPSEKAILEKTRSFPWRESVVGVWLIGIGVGIGVQAMALLQLHRLRTGAVRTESDVLQDIAKRVGLVRVPPLYVTEAPIEPLTMGAFLPQILLARRDLQLLSETELQSILTHECLHIKRGDLFLSFIPWLAQTLFWFLPPMYLALHEFELAREAACDQQTIATLTVAPRLYGELLVRLSSAVSPLPVPSSVMALSAGFRNLKRRLQMLEIKPYSRRPLACIMILVGVLLLPWRLTVASPEIVRNLDFSQGLGQWYKTAMGSNTVEHPFYEVGVDDKERLNGKPSGFVRSRTTVDFSKQNTRDGGVLRYDLADLTRYAGKRVRWRGSIKGHGITRHAFLFIGVETPALYSFFRSPYVLPKNADWIDRECVVDVPQEAVGLSLGLRLEGQGEALGNQFTLEVVDKTVPLTKPVHVEYTGPQNLDFSQGLNFWWNDNPGNTADKDYTIGLVPSGLPGGGKIAYLKNKVASPRSYGTIAQNAEPGAFLGKRIRISANLKSQNAKEASLWIVVHDKEPGKGGGENGESSGKVIRGTQGWTHFEYVVDVPKSTTYLSFGISSEGKGTVWVDRFHIEAIR